LIDHPDGDRFRPAVGRSLLAVGEPADPDRERLGVGAREDEVELLRLLPAVELQDRGADAQRARQRQQRIHRHRHHQRDEQRPPVADELQQIAAGDRQPGRPPAGRVR